MRDPALLITCEHGGNRVPARWRRLFRGRRALLASHRGFDRGALAAARHLARALAAPLHAATVTRLLVDLNRTEGNPRLFSAVTRGLEPRERESLLARHHRPHRRAVERAVRALARRGQVVHVALHSFVPVLDGRLRDFEVGLLYDPARALERRLARAWRRALAAAAPAVRVRFNRPYLGRSDGLTRWLRTRFAERRYAGIELEINQKEVAGRRGRVLRAALAASLGAVLGRGRGRGRRAR